VSGGWWCSSKSSLVPHYVIERQTVCAVPVPLIHVSVGMVALFGCMYGMAVGMLSRALAKASLES
jgi:hypothetical protein